MKPNCFLIYSAKLWPCLFIACCVPAYAEVVTDASLGKPIQSLSGNMTIPQSLGIVMGSNLFHSFSTFNIGASETATFTGDSTLKNVISRVTGGNPSTINGLLKSEIPNANFYFINPAGVTFGANAVVDVPSAFHVSTANQINFQDGSVYSATDPNASTLTIAEPASFGFATPSPAAIQINGSQLSIKNGQSLDLSAGSITIQDNAKLSAPAGEIRLVATKGNESVSLARTSDGVLSLPTQTPTTNNAGNISANNSVITTRGNGGGRVTLWGGEILFKNSFLRADNEGNVNAIAGKGLGIKAHSFTAFLTDDFIAAYLAEHNTNFIGSTIGSDSLPGAGRAGDINVTAETINLLHGGSITADTLSDSDAANVTVTAHTLNIDGQFSNLKVGDDDKVTVFTGVSSDTWGSNTSGNSGNVSITTDTVKIVGFAFISATTETLGNAGNIYVHSKDLTINGQNNLWLTGIRSTTTSSGNAGRIDVIADTINLLNAGTIVGNSWTEDGNAANITVNAKHIKIDSQGSSWWTGIISDLVYGASGQAGIIKVNTDTLEILNDGFISSASLNGDGGTIPAPINSNGNPGDVIINAQQSVYLNHGKIRTLTSGTGLGGSIQINSPLVTLDNGAEITATSSTESYSGNIKIAAAVLNLLNDSKITVATIPPDEKVLDLGNAGDITIDSGMIFLQNSGLFSTVKTTKGNGGNINVNADVLVMDSGAIQANAVGGSGGDITLNLKALIPSQDTLIKGGSQVVWQPYKSGFNVIQAASASGVSGNINLTSPQFNISGSISGLESNELAAPNFTNNPCQSLYSGSSLAHGSQGGVPVSERKSVFFPAAVEQEPQTTPVDKNEDSSKQLNQPCTTI